MASGLPRPQRRRRRGCETFPRLTAAMQHRDALRRERLRPLSTPPTAHGLDLFLEDGHVSQQLAFGRAPWEAAGRDGVLGLSLRYLAQRLVALNDPAQHFATSPSSYLDPLT